MRNLRLTDAQDTGFEITDRHFGGNIIATKYTDDGQTFDHFRTAVDELDISDLRYPAGQPDVVYADGLLKNGELPDHVHRFFQSVEDRAGQVVVVTPTFSSYGGAAELERFAELVLEAYGPQVRSFEVGNEYWQYQGETEYGVIANESVLALNRAMETTGVEAKIWVQMANASGASSDYKTSDTLGWIDRTVEANKAIIAELSTEALDRIDALVEHAYLRDTNQLLGDEIDATNMLWLDIETWRDQTGRDYDLALTEWNIRTTNEDQLGVKAASSLLHHFENLIQLGADEMHIWSPQHNTATDLAGSRDVILDKDTGVVANTVTGAAYDLMSSNLVGKSLQDLEIEGSFAYISTHGYANASELTVYVASRSEQVEAVSFSLGGAFEGAVLTNATLIGYDQTADSSDGVHWFQPEQRFVESQYVMVDGARYYLNEHDATAKVETLDVNMASATGTFNFDLLPYEVVELTYSLPSVSSVLGTSLDDRKIFDEGDQFVEALDGNDTVEVGQGSDTVYGGGGEDHLVLGADDDLAFGEAGNDFISGWGGHDRLMGGAGDDTVYGFQGDDHLEGEVGSDVLRGDDGNDLLRGGSGDDTLDGNAGFDVIDGDDGQDEIRGGAEADRLNGGDGNDVMLGEDGADYLFGGADHDTLEGGMGADTLLGGRGADLVSGDAGSDRILGGAGNDWLSGGAGNDRIHAGAGADTIDSGAGDDILTGNSSADTFVFAEFHGHDTITDFETDMLTEHIELRGFSAFSDFATLRQSMRQEDGDVVIATDSSSSIRLKNMNIDDLDENDFVF